MPGSKSFKKSHKSSGKLEEESDKNTDLIVKDLGIQYDKTLKSILDEIENTKKRIRNNAATFISSIPVAFRSCTLKEIKARNINLLSSTSNFQKNDSHGVLSKFLNKKSAKKPKRQSSGITKKVLGSKRKSILSKKRFTSSKTGRVRPSQPLTSGKRLSNTENRTSEADDSYVELGDDEVFFTPNSRNHSKNNYITPKFDISKPLKRSLLRTARPGERVVSLSGSPLLVEDVNLPGTMNHSMSKDQNQVIIGKKTYHFPNPQMRRGQLNPKELQKISALQKQLAELTETIRLH